MKLDIGCGSNKEEGWYGIDIVKTKCVDEVCNIDKESIPLSDSSVKEIKCIQVLEHCVNIIKIMNEIYRVCEDNALIKIVVPYANTPKFVQDPTHRTSFNEYTFPKYLINPDYVDSFSDYGNKCNFELVDQYIQGKDFAHLDLFIILRCRK